MWQWPQNANCWTLYYDYTARRWLLDGGQGLVVYGMSSAFSCNGPNTFDVIITDQTGGQAPDAITLWPLSSSTCDCPYDLRPFGQTVKFVPSKPSVWAPASPASVLLSFLVGGPSIRQELSVSPVAFLLTPSDPSVSQPVFLCPTGLYFVPSGPSWRYDPGPAAVALTLTPSAAVARPHTYAEPLTLSFVFPTPALAARQHLGPGALTLAFTLPTPALAAGQHLGPGAVTLTLTPSNPKASSGPSGVPCNGTGSYASLTGTFSAGTGGYTGVNGTTVPIGVTGTGNWQGTAGGSSCFAGQIVFISCSSDNWTLSASGMFLSTVPATSHSYSPTFQVVWNLSPPGGACGSGTTTFTLTL
jgi:hypothetical protein